jgi:hypothetical protein
MNPVTLIVIALVLLAVFLYWGITFIILYHLNRFGVGVQPKYLSTIFFFGSAILSVISIFIFLNIDVSVLQEQLQLIGNTTFFSFELK